MLKLGGAARIEPVAPQASGVGLTASIGTGLFTEYLLPFEVTSVLILMALVGAITLARRTATPRLAAPGNIDTEPPIPARGGGLRIQPGDTEATGQAYAKFQIEHGEAASPSAATPKNEAAADDAGEEGEA